MRSQLIAILKYEIKALIKTNAVYYCYLSTDVEQLVCSHEQKLQLVKSSVSSLGGPIKLIATAPEVQTVLSDFPSPSIPILTEHNPYPRLNSYEEPDANTDVDFTRAEDFFQLETQIDVKQDHSVLKTALMSPEGTFLTDLMSSYTLPTQRLAFIQQLAHPNSLTVPQPNTFIMGNGQDNKELIVSCQGCGEMFSCLTKFQRHILSHPDPENKKFLCQICGKRFNRADHLNRHSILHGDVAHKCLLCGEEFDRASHLDRHRRKNHPPLGQDPSQTPPTTPLAKRPPDPPLLPSIGNNLHLLAAVATPEDTQDLTQEQILQMEASRVVSEILINDVESDKRSSNKRPLSEVERPFVCDVCDRKFIRSTHLRRHMRIHTGEKPFACHICGRKYARGDYLRAHIQGHRRDRVHKCKHCNEIFHDLTRFANHCRLLHQEDENDGSKNGTPITVQCYQDETPISMETMNSVHFDHTPSSPASRRMDDLALSAAHFSPDLLQVFTTSSSPSLHSNGILSATSDNENEVGVVLSDKVGRSQMLETLTQFFITGTGPFLGNEQTHT